MQWVREVDGVDIVCSNCGWRFVGPHAATVKDKRRDRQPAHYRKRNLNTSS